MNSPTPTLPPTAARPRRLRVVALALPVCLSLSSCFTLGLWGFDHTTSNGDSSWELDESEWEGDHHIPWYVRLALTPFTLAADVATLRIQYWLFAGDDDDDCPRRRRGRGC